MIYFLFRKYVIIIEIWKNRERILFCQKISIKMVIFLLNKKNEIVFPFHFVTWTKNGLFIINFKIVHTICAIICQLKKSLAIISLD